MCTWDRYLLHRLSHKPSSVCKSEHDAKKSLINYFDNVDMVFTGFICIWLDVHGARRRVRVCVRVV